MQRATTPGAHARRAAASAVLAVALAVPASAQAAPTLAFDRSCYPEGAPMGFSGTGYTPGGDVNLFFAANGRLGNFDTKADPAGALNGVVDAPQLSGFGSRGSRVRLGVTANDQTRIAQGAPPEEQFGAATVLVSRWDVGVAAWDTASSARPRAMTTVTAVGWDLLGRTLFAHYRRAGKTVKSVRVGALTGPCGDLEKRLRQFPFRPVPAGTYRVVFSTTRLYQRAAPSITYRAVKVRAKDAVR